MATVKCPVGGEAASLPLWTEAFKRISLFQQGVRCAFCSCTVSALGNQMDIICVLTADSPRLQKYLRNNPQPIRRGQTHSCSICGCNVLSVGKKILHSNQCLFATVQRTQRRPCILHWSFFPSRKSESPLKWCVDRWKTRDLRLPLENRLNNRGSPEAPGKKDGAGKCGPGIKAEQISKYSWLKKKREREITGME